MHGLTTTTDPMGRYLFRDLAAGSYALSVQNEPVTSGRTIRLGAQPVDLANVDFQIRGPIASDAPALVAVPAKSQPPDAPAPVLHPVKVQLLDVPAPAVLPAKPQRRVATVLESGSAAAQRPNYLGRQLAKEGRYQE